MARQTAQRKPAGKRDRAGASRSTLILTLIAVFKLLKAALLIALGVAALRLLHGDAGAKALHWVEALRVDPDNRFVHGALARIFRVTPKQLKALSLGTFFYAALFAIEGLGLLWRKRWAEYFTILTTGALIPLEVFELTRHFTPVKLAVMAINLLIVWYLVARLRSS